MEFRLPELGEGVHEGELVKWKVKPGDTVNYDQPLCDVMTDKATMEIPSAFQGKVEALHVKEGEAVKVGQLMCTFEGAAGAAKKADAPAAHAPAPTPAPASASTGGGNGHATPAQKPIQSPSRAPAPGAAMAMATVGDTTPATRVLAAPSTRRLAREMGVDLGRVQGSGPAGRVMRSDLERAPTIGTGMGATAAGLARPAPRKPLAPIGGEERVVFKGLRKKISEKMRQSKDHAAHFTYVEEADATDLVKLRKAAKEMGAEQGVKVTFLPFVMKAMVAALREYPILNSSLDEEKQELVYKHYYNIGVSIQTEDGLTAPNVKDVGSKNIFELARDIQDLAERARSKRLTREDFEGGTITITNAGTIGGLFATPIIQYPEVAILGLNKIFRKPVAVMEGGTEKIAVRDWTYFSISLDHRVVDGAIGAEFMKKFIYYIENPSILFLTDTIA